MSVISMAFSIYLYDIFMYLNGMSKQFKVFHTSQWFFDIF